MRTIVKNVPVWDRKLQAGVTIDVDVEIDIYDVARRLAQRAYENKSGKSAALENGIQVTRRPAAKEVA
jgi:hypothetical protein